MIDSDVWSEIKSRVREAWAEIPDSKIFLGQEVNKVNRERSENDGYLSPPFVIVHVHESTPNASTVANWEEWLTQVLFCYVIADDDSRLSPNEGFDLGWVNAKMRDLSQNLFRRPGVLFRCTMILPNGDASWSNELNAIYYSAIQERSTAIVGCQILTATIPDEP